MRLRFCSRMTGLVICILWLGLAQAVAQTGDQIDWKRAQQIHQKFLRGEKLTDEEQAYHDRAAKALQADAGKQADDGIDWKRANQLHERLNRGEKLTAEERAYHDRAAKALQASHRPPPAKPPTGLKPLSDMAAEDRYKGEDGGLYGGGKNEPPERHLQTAMKQAKLIRPLDAEGKPADDGKIVLISVGMSNTTEPYAYESAFVVRWLIQDQIKGSLAKSPLLLWGPYLWADGEKGRKLDDLVWKAEDLVSDGTHPSPNGRRKVAELLLRFMKNDPTAKTWFFTKNK